MLVNKRRRLLDFFMSRNIKVKASVIQSEVSQTENTNTAY